MSKISACLMLPCLILGMNQDRIPTMGNRCIWSGKTNTKLKTLEPIEHKGQQLKLFAVPEHAAKATTFLQSYQKHRILFQRLMAVGLMLVILSTFSSAKWIESVGWAHFRNNILNFPFWTSPRFSRYEFE